MSTPCHWSMQLAVRGPAVGGLVLQDQASGSLGEAVWDAACLVEQEILELYRYYCGGQGALPFKVRVTLELEEGHFRVVQPQRVDGSFLVPAEVEQKPVHVKGRKARR